MGQLLGDDLHTLRVLSLANGVAGVLAAAVLSIHAIGQAYAHLANVKPKSGVKQVDRLLSNDGIDIALVIRDTKDLHFGMGLSATHIRDAGRRDRLLFLVALAHPDRGARGDAAEGRVRGGPAA